MTIFKATVTSDYGDKKYYKQKNTDYFFYWFRLFDNLDSLTAVKL